MKTENISNFGTIIASLLATSCCVGPAIFVVFGTSIGFLGKFSFLEPFTPFFLGAAVLMLGFSFWKLYLKNPDCSCESEIARSRNRRHRISNIEQEIMNVEVMTWSTSFSNSKPE